MHGAATARSEAHAARLALIYALLDASNEIDLEDLEAALAVWTYAQASSEWTFGDSLGDPTADDIWTLAKNAPMGSVAPRSATCSAETRKLVRSTAH